MREYEAILMYLQEWIIEQWERNYYISAIAGASNGSSLVVMSKGQASGNCFITEHVLHLTPLFSSPGTQYTQQSYKFSDSFPFKWISKKWKEGFYVTSMATAGSRWGVVMSRNAGYSNQVSFLEFLQPVFPTLKCC